MDINLSQDWWAVNRSSGREEVSQPEGETLDYKWEIITVDAGQVVWRWEETQERIRTTESIKLVFLLLMHISTWRLQRQKNMRRTIFTATEIVTPYLHNKSFMPCW